MIKKNLVVLGVVDMRQLLLNSSFRFFFSTNAFYLTISSNWCYLFMIIQKIRYLLVVMVLLSNFVLMIKKSVCRCLEIFESTLV